MPLMQLLDLNEFFITWKLSFCSLMKKKNASCTPTYERKGGWDKVWYLTGKKSDIFFQYVAV